jgi:drug/metabolite transporter (DMT)-like permease
MAWLGVLLVVSAALSIAYASILARRLDSGDALVVAGGQMMASFALLLPLALGAEGLPSWGSLAWQGWAALLWAGIVGMFLGNIVRYAMIRRFGATFTAAAQTPAPVFASLAGVLLLKETITVLMVVGALVLLSGVLVVNSASTTR